MCCTRTECPTDNTGTMNSLYIELKKRGIQKFQNQFTVTPEVSTPKNEIQLWVLLNQLEEATAPAFKILKKTAPFYQKQKEAMNFQMYQTPQLGELVEIECRFYELPKKEVELRVFARVRKPNNKSKRVAKLTYHIRAIHENELQKAS